MRDTDRLKREAAERAVELVSNDQTVGLGTGSTAKFAIEALARRIREGLTIKGVATSIATERIATGLSIPMIDLNEALGGIDITLDGADEVDPAFNMIKGGGGAMTREKLVALSSKRRVIFVDDSKLVAKLGETRPLPVEVLPFAWRLSARLLNQKQATTELRDFKGAPFLTDNGNYVLDCNFGPIDDPAVLEKEIKLMPGVIECGLFIDIADVLVIGFEDRVELRARPA